MYHINRTYCLWTCMVCALVIQFVHDGSLLTPQDGGDLFGAVKKETVDVVEARPPARRYDVPPELAQQALDFVLSRREAFHESGLAWRFHGLGYLYLNHYMILAAMLPTTSTTNPAKIGEIHSVKIYDAHPKNAATRSNCHDFTLWVRVRGPEVIAGAAQAVSSNTSTAPCHWTFDFELNTPGDYKVDAKILLYASQNRILTNEALQQCDRQLPNITGPNDLAAIYPLHSGFKGFKLYQPKLYCCEFCTRMAPHCVYWASPPFRTEKPSGLNNGCEFFFRDDTPEELIPRTHLLEPGNRTVMWNLPKQQNESEKRPAPGFGFLHGKPRDDLPAHNYIGCGWSSWYTLDFPCLSGDLDDKVFMTSDQFTVGGKDLDFGDDPSSGEETSNSTNMSSPRGLPLCSIETEMVDKSKGRWVREPWPNSTVCPREMKMDDKYSTKFDITEYDPNFPHCWNRDDLSKIGDRCIESECRFIDKSSWYISPFKNRTWYGVWRQDSCEYLEFTNDELQGCITDRRIASIDVKGASIAQFLNQYLQQRLENLQFFNGSGARFVELETLGLVHYCADSDYDLRRRFTNMKNAKPNTTDRYVVTAPFVSSEREIYVHADRVAKMNRIVQDILSTKGYKFLDFFDLSAAFTYASATQMDGLHIVGPPMKMIITKLFHYVQRCGRR
jgi:hypothetical protein